MLKPAASKNFDVYATVAKHILIHLIVEKLQSATRVDIVWNTYKEEFIKSTARIERGAPAQTCGRLLYHTRQLNKLLSR